jgi:hypothetical protein
VGGAAARPGLEVADIIRASGNAYREEYPVSFEQEAVMRHLVECRTAALGGHAERCDRCGHLRVSYNSCRDRHCPKCQSLKRAEWLDKRLERLLPVPHFHVVFTLPSELNRLMLHNKRVMTNILFDSAAKTMKQLARDDKHLGADIGFTAILHTWGQNLEFHPHLHCVATGGGLSPDDKKWIPARLNFFLPVKVMGKLFRGKFLHALAKVRKTEKLVFVGNTAHLSNPTQWRTLVDKLYSKNWIVYAKPPFGGLKQVFRYLGRYTHRIAISNHRLVSLEDGKVTFRLKDYADGNRRKHLTLEAVEFVRRFLLHVLPKNLTRIRHFGLYASQNVRGKLSTAQMLFQQQETAKPPSQPVPWWEKLFSLTGFDVLACPHCKEGRYVPCSIDIHSIPEDGFLFDDTG